VNRKDATRYQTKTIGFNEEVITFEIRLKIKESKTTTRLGKVKSVHFTD